MSTNRELRIVSEQLPPMPKLDAKGEIIFSKVIISGVKYAEIFPQIIDEKEFDITSNYYVSKALQVDHFMEMKKVFKTGGKDAVKEYVMAVMQANEPKGDIS